MCKIVSVGTLDRIARDFVDSFGGYGIVADEDLGEVSSRQEEEREYVEPAPIVRKPVALAGGMW